MRRWQTIAATVGVVSVLTLAAACGPEGGSQSGGSSHASVVTGQKASALCFFPPRFLVVSLAPGTRVTSKHNQWAAPDRSRDPHKITHWKPPVFVGQFGPQAPSWVIRFYVDAGTIVAVETYVDGAWVPQVRNIQGHRVKALYPAISQKKPRRTAEGIITASSPKLRLAVVVTAPPSIAVLKGKRTATCPKGTSPNAYPGNPGNG